MTNVYASRFRSLNRLRRTKRTKVAQNSQDKSSLIILTSKKSRSKGNVIERILRNGLEGIQRTENEVVTLADLSIHEQPRDESTSAEIPQITIADEDDHEEDEEIIFVREVAGGSSSSKKREDEKAEEAVIVEEPPAQSTMDLKVAETSTTLHTNPSQRGRKRRSLTRLADGLNNEAQAKNLPPVRFWHVIKNAEEVSQPTTTIRACTYNILCQTTMHNHPHLYRHLSNQYSRIPWSSRWRSMYKELINIDADIFALQEVEESLFHEDIHPFMKSGLFETMYTRKSSTLYPDGCLLAWKKDAFECIRRENVTYFREHNNLMNFPQIGQIAVLKCLVTGELIVVANTHIVFNMKRGDTKLGQMAILFAHIHEIRSNLGRKSSLILMGDFNMFPGSACYQYAVKSKVNVSGKNPKTLAFADAVEGPHAPSFTETVLPVGDPVCRDGMFLTIGGQSIHRQLEPDTFTHPFNLQSVYSHGWADKQEISTYHADLGNPDFIFYDVDDKKESETSTIPNEKPSLRLLSRYSLPDIRQLEHMERWPNQHVSSDHIPLIANFQVTANQ